LGSRGERGDGERAAGDRLRPGRLRPGPGRSGRNRLVPSVWRPRRARADPRGGERGSRAGSLARAPGARTRAPRIHGRALGRSRRFGDAARRRGARGVKILHVVPSYLPAWRYGGPIRSVHGLARAAVARGHAVEVFTTNADGASRLDVPTDRAVERD